jgi:hypothetical protein
MTFFPGAPRDAEVTRQYSKAKQDELQAEADARHDAHELRDQTHDARQQTHGARPHGRLRRLLRRHT